MKFILQILFQCSLLSGLIAQDIPLMDGSLNYLEKGKRLESRGSLLKALHAYESGLERSERPEDYHLALGRVSKDLRNYENAESYYALAYENDSIASTGVAYAEVLAMNGKHDKAEAVLLSIDQDSNLTNRRKLGFARSEALMEYSGIYDVILGAMNTASGEYYAAEIQNQLYISSNRGKRLFGKENGLDDGGFSDLYKNSGDGFRLDKSLSSDYNQGPFFYAKASEELFLTENHRVSLKNKDRNSPSKLKISIYKKSVNGRWVLQEELPINDVSYSVGHPFFDENTQRLYFASDMPGGKGGTDLYYICRNGSTWGEPRALSQINTEADELYPYIHAQKIYFTSNGYEGLGGLDIYESKLHDLKKVKNLGAPVNSIRDDFGFTVANQKEGYFISDREKGVGKDDVYQWSSNSGMMVLNVLGSNALTVNSIEITPANKDFYELEMIGDSLLLSGIEGASYRLLVNESGFEPYDKSIVLEDKSVVEIKLVPRIKEEEIDRARIVVVENISGVQFYRMDVDQLVKLTDLPDSDFEKISMSNFYFEFDSDKPKESSDVLQQISDLMNSADDVSLELFAYSDSRGSALYNNRLAKKRGEAVAALIIASGVNESRISVKAVGEKVITNDCVNGAECSEEEHAVNRRVEFTFN